MLAPAFLQLAGHPLRWRLLGELGRSDLRVNELTGRVGEPQNLVSYHLGKLRNAGLVSARSSSADGRDSYYSVDLVQFRELLAAAGSALHAGLVLAPASSLPIRRERVLFLCTGNSARSQIAEALARARSGGQIEAYSAGSHPKELHADAVRVMKDEYKMNLRGHRAKHLREFAGERFHRVITLCDKVREVCPSFPGRPATAHWSMADPSVADDGYAAFQRTARELDTRIGFLVAALSQSQEESW